MRLELSLKVTMITVALMAAPASAQLPDREAIATLLPPNVRLDTIAFAERITGPGPGRRTTVEDELTARGARVDDGKLVDGTGREIRFL